MKRKYIAAAFFTIALCGTAVYGAGPKISNGNPAVTAAAVPDSSAATAVLQPKEFEVDGVRVILKQATNNVISAKLFITGGVRNYELPKQGIESLTLAVLTDAGSAKYPKETFHNLTENKGIYITGSAGYDFSALSLRTLSMNWNQAWDVWQDVLLHPSWDLQAFEQDKGQMEAGLQQSTSDPDDFLRNMSLSKTFKDKPYERRPEGTPESVDALTLSDLKEHYGKIMQRKKMLLVVVGKVDEADLKLKIHALLSGFPEGKADVLKSQPVDIKLSTIAYEQREIATNYIRGVFNAPPAGTREALAMRLGVAMLSDRLFVEVRTKRNLSYAPSANVAPLFDPYSILYVTTTKPNEAIQVMTDELRKVKKDGFKAKELEDEKQGFLTSYYLGQETNEAQAQSLGSAELIKGWEYAQNFRQEVSGITLDEVNAVFRKYVSGISWYYLGKKDQVDEKIFLKGIE
jgi:predicted Zn-dependent peptidase